MNVQFYTARISDAAASAMLAADFGREAFEDKKLGVAAVHAAVDYLAELHAGDLIRMASGVKRAEGRKLKFHQRLFNAETAARCMNADVLGLFFDLQTQTGSAAGRGSGGQPV